MKKNILINETQLKILIEKVLVEATIDKNRIPAIVSAYTKIIDAVSGWGTNEEEVLSALRLIVNANEALVLFNLFKDKRTGYSSFIEMVKNEYEEDNFEDIAKLVQRLHELGLRFKFEWGIYDGKKIWNPRLFVYIGKVNTEKKVSGKKLEICTTTAKKALVEAVSFWRDWLKNPITKEKVKTNWELEKFDLNFIEKWMVEKDFEDTFVKYFNLLYNLKLSFFDESYYMVNGMDPKGALAFVADYGAGELSDNKIYFNCSKFTNYDNALLTLIHEIQHLIYQIKPLNPEKKMKNIFVTNNTDLETKNDIMNNLESSKTKKYEEYENEIKNAASDLLLDKLYLFSWKDNADMESLRHPGYACELTETMSHISSIRKILGLKPGDNITYKMLKPYIIFDKKDTDIYWFLVCWASKGFPDINKVLNNINQLAIKNNKKIDSKSKESIFIT